MYGFIAPGPNPVTAFGMSVSGSLCEMGLFGPGGGVAALGMRPHPVWAQTCPSSMGRLL
jgi:hypothetical protein